MLGYLLLGIIHGAIISNLIKFTEPGMIFDKYGDWLDFKYDEWILKYPKIPFWGKPLFGCSVCTAFWTSIFTFWFLPLELSLCGFIIYQSISIFISKY